MMKKPLEYALFLLSIRDRTKGEIRQKMREKKYEESEIEETVRFLIQNSFLDDDRFVKNLLKSERAKSMGKFKLRQRLINLHFENETINQALSQLDSEYEKALDLAKKWKAKKPDLERQKMYEKLGRFLAGRGFEIDVVKKVLGEILNNF